MAEAPQRSDTSGTNWLPLSVLVGGLGEACYTQRGEDSRELMVPVNPQWAVGGLGRTKDATGETHVVVSGHVPRMNSSECGCGRLSYGSRQWG